MRLHLACLFLVGCGGADITFGDASDNDGTTGMPDSAGTDGTMMMSDTGTTTDTGTMTDGTMIIDAAKDSGTCGLMPVDGGMGCNTLPTTGQAIKPNCHGGGPPTAVGGVIQDGHYVLTAIDYYSFNTTCPMETEKIDWVMCGNQWETAQVSGNQPAAHFNVTATVQSPKVALAILCPNAQAASWGYDVTGQGIVFYLPGPNGSTRATTYTKM